jgi:hypothetical protein
LDSSSEKGVTRKFGGLPPRERWEVDFPFLATTVGCGPTGTVLVLEKQAKTTTCAGILSWEREREREKLISTLQRMDVRSTSLRIEMTGSMGTRGKGNGKDRSRSLRDDNQKGNDKGDCKRKRNSGGKCNRFLG